MTSGSAAVIVAGAGVAGLSAALALARHGFPVELYERSEELREIGAGLQLSPNATNILARLGVLDAIRRAAVRPEAVVLRSAASLAELARAPLGSFAEERWGAPYLVIHRADLQQALLAAVKARRNIRLVGGATVLSVTPGKDGVAATIQTARGLGEVHGRLGVVADGVWSRLRLDGTSRFTGQMAWRRTLSVNDPAAGFAGHDVVTAFLDPNFHLIAYPISGGAEINVVAFTAGDELSPDWAAAPSVEPLGRAFTAAAGPIRSLMRDDWTGWPIYTTSPASRWTHEDRIAVIGDAAHAMTPFAAQGAAMAIEDAYTLANGFATTPDDIGKAMTEWEAGRRSRIARVRRRGAFNRFVWNAAGPVAAARNLALRLRSAERLASDLDWLYGWKPADPPSS